MDQNILVAIIGSVSALVGAGVGSVITYYTTKSLKTQEWKRSVKKDMFDEKKKVYASFLKEYNELLFKHYEEREKDPLVFNDITFLYSQIELLSNEPLVEVAHELLTEVILRSQKNKNQSSEDSPILRKKFIAHVQEDLNNHMSLCEPYH